MLRISRCLPAALCAPALITAAIAASPSGAGAASVPVDLRVLTVEGKVLADQRQYVSPSASLRADPRAECFGAGTGGSGRRLAVPGATALGVLGEASESDPDLRPVSVTDYDFGFPGIGLCGIGSQRAGSDEFWFLKVNHRNPQISGDRARVGPGASVIWYLIPFSKCSPVPPYFCPPELVLRAPARAEPGVPFGVRVLRIDDAGRSRPATGVAVDGADLPTDAEGETRAVLTGSRRIRAVRPGSIPSAPVPVCVGGSAECPAKRGRLVFGSRLADRIAGTPGDDEIRSRAGDDTVNVRGGGSDRVDCGPGADTVVLGPGDTARRCETERRPR